MRIVKTGNINTKSLAYTSHSRVWGSMLGSI